MPTTTKTCQSDAREATLLTILRASGVFNENGDQVVDFAPQGRDALDFASLSRDQIKSMLDAAYLAGALAASAKR